MFILVHTELGKCYDLVENTFPVASPLMWIEVSEPYPQHGWVASFVDDSWVFEEPPGDLVP